MSIVEDARRLPREQKLAGGAAIALFVSMFLPWYTRSVPRGGINVKDDFNAFQVFSWVEAAVLLVAAAVLWLLYARSQKRGFHLPGGDGTAIFLAGLWTALLLIWRWFDKPNLEGDEGIQWGIFLALMAAGALAWAGLRMRAAHRPEPPLPVPTEVDERPPRGGPRVERTPDRRPHTAPTEPLADDQLALDNPPPYEPRRRPR